MWQSDHKGHFVEASKQTFTYVSSEPFDEYPYTTLLLYCKYTCYYA
jgi:hypothetical protein